LKGECHRPSPVSVGCVGSRFLASYPDGTESDFDLGGHILRPGDELPGKGGIVLDRWDVTDIPIERGEFGVVGILRDPKSSVSGQEWATEPDSVSSVELRNPRACGGFCEWAVLGSNQ
jgi:hypothetical protein